MKAMETYVITADVMIKTTCILLKIVIERGMKEVNAI